MSRKTSADRIEKRSFAAAAYRHVKLHIRDDKHRPRKFLLAQAASHRRLQDQFKSRLYIRIGTVTVCKRQFQLFPNAGFRGRRIVARHPLRTQGNLPCRLAVYDVLFQLPHQCRQRRFLERRIKQTQQIVVSSVLRCQIDQAAYQFRRTFRQLADDNTETSPLPQAALTSRRKNSHLIASNLSIKFMPASSFSYILPATKDSLTGAGFEPA